MNIYEYIAIRIEALKDADRTQFEGIHRESTKEERLVRISELENLQSFASVWEVRR